ncbi:MAG: hypothetical protein OEW60_08305 [Thiovulaceae bacterium]|nr:hypothetical protein [Sulfurimonadaceae bacterium]
MSSSHSSKDYFDQLSNHLFQETTVYKFNSSTLSASDRYRKGRLSVLSWANELSFYFLSQEKRLPQQMMDMLMRKQEELWSLSEGEYRQGVIDAFDGIFEHIEKLETKSV